MRSAGCAAIGLVTGVVGIGTAWHGSDVVENSTVVVVAEPGAAVVDGFVVGFVDTLGLLPPHAPSTSAPQHPTIMAIRTHPSWHH
ncbi:MAG TPA: hypothetical protein VIJ48_03480 [Acidimicrobiia bacterium]